MDKKAIRQVALAYLARRDFTQQELVCKLKQKKFRAAEIEEMIAELKSADYLNDMRFIENYIAMRRRKGYGPIRIKMELEQKGIASELIADQLDSNDNSWYLEISKVWQKHFKGKPATNLNEKAKQARYLQYRGFTVLQIETVFKNRDTV